MAFPPSGRPFSTFLTLLATLFLTGCAKDNALDCVKSTGKIVTEKRPLPAFTELRVEDNPDILLVPDTVFYAEVTAGENLLKNLETSVTDGRLLIRNRNKCNWVRSYDKPMKVTLHHRPFKVISHDGYGTIRNAGTLKPGQLFLHVTGAGDLDLETETSLVWLDMYELGNVKISGQTRELKAMVMSSGKLGTDNLETTDATLLLASDGDATVQASGALNATINGRGNVFYLGNPAQVTREGKGTGQLIRK